MADIDFAGKVAVVTGASRGIGRVIALGLARRGAAVVGTARRLDFSPGVGGTLEETFAMIEAAGGTGLAVAGSITDAAGVRSVLAQAKDAFGRIDILVNNAGVAGAPGWSDRPESTEEDWLFTFGVNVKGPANAANSVMPHMKEARYGKVLNLASIAGREGRSSLPHYSASKAASDHLVRSYHRTYGLPIKITNCSNNYGPRQFPEKLIPLMSLNALDRKALPVYGEGLNVRDWLHVDDHCEAILAVLERGERGRTYNIGGNNERSNIDLTHQILSIMGFGDEMIQPVKDRPGHDRRYALDAVRIERELGWTPSRSAWPLALRETIAWYKDNPQWWRRVKSGAYRAYYEQQYGSKA